MYCYGYCIAMFYLCMSYRCRVHSLFQEIDKLAFIVKVCSDGISIGAQVVSLLVELLWDKALASSKQTPRVLVLPKYCGPCTELSWGWPWGWHMIMLDTYAG